MFTEDGLKWLWGRALDQLQGGQLVVLDGDDDPGEPQRAAADVESVELTVEDDGGVEVTLTATFGADEANMEWRRRQVVTADGVVLDDAVDDHGRKAQGAVWTLAATLELGPQDDDGD